MSNALPNQYFSNEQHSFLIDREFAATKDYSEQTAEKIDSEIAKLISEAAKRAETVIRDNRKLLDKLAKELLQKETLEEDEITKLLKGSKLPKAVAA